MTKMSNFIIALILIALASSIIGLLFAKFNTAYPKTYDNSTFNNINQLSNLTQQTETIQDATDINERSGVLDIIGGYFSSAYQSLKITTASIQTFNDMADETASKIGIDEAGTIKSALMTIVLILIFIGAIISTMVKRES